MSMLSRGNQLVDFKHFENVKSLFENVSLYIGLIAYTAAGAKVRSSRLQGVNSIDINVGLKIGPRFVYPRQQE